MIRNLFFPDQFRNYYLFKKRVIGFDIGKTHITATQVVFRGYAIIVEKIITESIEVNNDVDYTENVGKTVQVILQQLDSYDEIRTAFNSATVIFKQLRLPFIGREQIGMTVGFEVEPLLPFPLQDTVIDFIITSENIAEKSSEVLVAAVQKQHIGQHLALFEAAQINPSVICIDFFSIYSFYRKSTGYSIESGSVVLVDMGSHTTALGYVLNGQLRLVRSLPKGSYHLVKQISEALDISAYQAMEMVIRYGLEGEGNSLYQKVIIQAASTFWREISFTLQSFEVQTQTNSSSALLLLFGGASVLKGLPIFVTKTIARPCEIWNIDLAAHDCNFTVSSSVHLSPANVMSLATALPFVPAGHCSLRQQEFANPDDASLFAKQFFVACALVCLLFAALITTTVLDVNSLHKEADESEMEARLELQSAMSGLLQKADSQDLFEQDNLDELVSDLEQVIKKEEKLWFSFANPSRISFLRYLLELTNKIDKKNLGFILQKLTINDGVMTIDAQVRDHEALKILEKELRQSKLFITVEGKEDPQFKAMKIKLAQTE